MSLSSRATHKLTSTQAPDSDVAEEKTPAVSSTSSTLAMLNHIKVFENAEGWINADSIADACMKKFHLPEKASTDLGKNTMLVAAGVGIKGVEKGGYVLPWVYTSGTGRFRAEDATGFNFHHPHDTGLFRKDGTFDEALFDAMLFDRPSSSQQALPADKIIVDRDPEHPDVRMIFASNLKQYMKVNCQDKNDSRWIEVAKSWNCLRRLIMNLVGKAGNKGEFDLLCQSDVVMVERVNPATEQRENAIAVEDLRAFYQDSKHYLTQKLEEKSTSRLVR
jgi:hypothetical protein